MVPYVLVKIPFLKSDGNVRSRPVERLACLLPPSLHGENLGPTRTALSDDECKPVEDSVFNKRDARKPVSVD